MTLQERPTPNYDRVTKKVRWIIKQATLFVKKYPYYKECLTDKEVLYKLELEYERSLSGKSMRIFFTMMAYDLTENLEYEGKEYKEVWEEIARRYSAYRSIQRTITDNGYVMKPVFYNCGCRGCLKEYPSNQFKNIKECWYLCNRCRKDNRLKIQIRKEFSK